MYLLTGACCTWGRVLRNFQHCRIHPLVWVRLRRPSWRIPCTFLCKKTIIISTDQSNNISNVTFLPFQQIKKNIFGTNNLRLNNVKVVSVVSLLNNKVTRLHSPLEHGVKNLLHLFLKRRTKKKCYGWRVKKSIFLHIKEEITSMHEYAQKSGENRAKNFIIKKSPL